MVLWTVSTYWTATFLMVVCASITAYFVIRSHQVLREQARREYRERHELRDSAIKAADKEKNYGKTEYPT